MHHGTISPEIARGLVALRKRIDAAQIPSSKIDETINVAVWNIREFGKKHRSQPAVHYIAEILGQFDLIAIVELRNDLTDLGRVLPILGPSWDVVYSDWIDDGGGNDERIAFLYDRRAVTFNGLAAEADPPRKKQGTEYLPSGSFWRAPYLCSFRSGNFDFIALATHIRWGDNIEGRKQEITRLADWIDNRSNDKTFDDHDLIVMGDFNTPDMGSALFSALTSHGLLVPDVLKNIKVGQQVIGGTNLEKTARYDQILHLPTVPGRFTNSGGTLDFFVDDSRIKELFPTEGYTREQFSYQISDHLPVWVQVKTDIEGEKLDQIIQDGKEV